MVAAFLLPFAQPARGQDWVQTSAPLRLWSGVACSADGTRLVAVARFTDRSYNPSGVYVSTNSGRTWSLTSAPILYWRSVASSADGLKLAAIGDQNPTSTPNAGIYRSADGGSTWTLTSAPLTNWNEITSSSDGTKLVANVWYGYVYASTNSGVTWMLGDAPFFYWEGLAASADGRKLAASGGEYPDPNIHHVFVSTNYGFNWTEVAAPNSLRELASSADGNRLVAVGDEVYLSADGAQSWESVGTAANEEWLAVAASADGANLFPVGMGATDTGQYFPSPIFASADFGNTWLQKGTVQGYWNGVASSSDGTKLVVCQGGFAAGYIYTWQQPPTLAIVSSADGLLISWPASAAEFVLQHNPDLTTTNWTGVTNAVTLAGNQNQVSVIHPAGNRFYRLTSP